MLRRHRRPPTYRYGFTDQTKRTFRACTWTLRREGSTRSGTSGHRDAGLDRVRASARGCGITTRSSAARREDSSGGVDVAPRPPAVRPAREELADEQAALRSMATLVAPGV